MKGKVIMTGIESDEKIVDRILKGEKQLYEKLMRKYNDRLFRISMSIVNDKAEAKDIIQSPFFFEFLDLKDKDVIKEAHTLQIYQHLQKAWLCIFPGGTHMMPETDPGIFNATVERFFSKPYYRPDTKLLFGVKD